MTPLTKRLPVEPWVTLDQIHVNTAFTRTCPEHSEIVVFREEEWFKVFVHETLHNFGVDFSDMNMEPIHQEILTLFPVDSDVNLFEAYTEWWAELWNVVFCAWSHSDKNFLSVFQLLMEKEIQYGLFQMTKVLDFMGLGYRDLYEQTEASQLLRQHFYKERTSVLSYYVIKNVLLFFWEDFLSWCHHYNKKKAMMEFTKTQAQLHLFFLFLKKTYKDPRFLAAVDDAHSFLSKKKGKKKKNQLDHFLIQNTRMTANELG
jgi:hypothetical protein